MNELLYLLGALVASVLGSVVILRRQREPDSPEHGIDAFRRELQALSPEQRPGHRPSPRPSPRPSNGRSSGEYRSG